MNIMKASIVTKSRFLISAGIFLAILSFLNSCTKSSMDNMTGMTTGTGSTTTSKPGANEVWIQGMAFNPSTLTVTAGTTVKWTNKDGITHTVTSNTGVFDSGNINSNGTFSFTFATAGTYPYHCNIHPSMTATVIVN
jgi:plastocyanin